MVYVIFSFMAVVIILLTIKVILLKKSAREIASAFSDRLQTDTNTLIGISSHDKDMRELADNINKQLRILRKEKLHYEQGNTELKNAVTNISHDLRTPLTAICGYLKMMKRMEMPQKIGQYLAIIRNRTEMMKQLTEELFGYSVIISDDSTMQIEEVSVNRALEDSIMGYYGAFSEKGIVPKVHITEKKIIRKLDKACISRIFSNLLNNALKYSDGDLEITLSDTGEIIFSNTAKGLSSVQAEQLFDRFYTVEAARKSTGLGLSIARTLVERMGGSISAVYNEKRLIIKIML